ncbi:MAG: hypothetical protein FWF10_06110 [Clostridiales bacterium]|nr:hypothetical protein [Clostridiales bacterium]
MAFTPEQQNLFEACLSKYLRNDIVALEEGYRTNSRLLDCLYNEVQGSINSAYYGHAITEEEADYLRMKY